MKARIQTYWDAEVKLNPFPEKNGADKRLECGQKMRLTPQPILTPIRLRGAGSTPYKFQGIF